MLTAPPLPSPRLMDSEPGLLFRIPLFRTRASVEFLRVGGSRLSQSRFYSQGDAMSRDVLVKTTWSCWGNQRQKHRANNCVVKSTDIPESHQCLSLESTIVGRAPHLPFFVLFLPCFVHRPSDNFGRRAGLVSPLPLHPTAGFVLFCPQPILTLTLVPR